MPRANQLGTLWWAVPAATFLLLMALIILLGGRQQSLGQAQSSYDASLKGVRAAYLLLEDLGFPVARSKRIVGGAARWVLFPEPDPKKAVLLDDWIRKGGVVAFTDDTVEFAQDLGMELTIKRVETDFDESATGAGVERLAGGPVRLDWPGHAGKVWLKAGGKPFITIYEHGQGQIWLLNRPNFLTNRLLRQADNAVLVCRLAEAMLADRPGTLEFDEYFHGMRERPGVLELLLQPPTVWVTVQAVLLLLVLLWHYMPRFGTMRFLPPARRRSKEEFLDAMAWLLERKRDFGEAYRTAREELVRDMERELGLPPQTPIGRLAEEAAQRRQVGSEGLRRALNGFARAGSRTGFVEALNELETTRDEFFHRRSSR